MGRNIKLIENDQVFFDGLTHTYLRKDNYKELIGVTSLMKLMGLSPDYSAIPADVLQKAADRGSAVHKAIETWCIRGEATISEEYADEVIPDLEAFKRLELPVLANEYLVSDNETIASSIDIVLKDLTLVDIKTTSKIHTEAVSWQLSIYKWLFELQNPKKKVKGLKCLHLRGGKCEYVDIPILPKEQILGLIEAYKDGAAWEKPGSAPIEITGDTSKALALLKELEEKALYYKIEQKRIEEEQKALKDGLLAFMAKENLTKWVINDHFTLTRVLAYDKFTLDTKRLQAENPEIYEAYKKKSTVGESLKIILK